MNLLLFGFNIFHKWFRRFQGSDFPLNEVLNELPLTVVITTYNNSKYCIENLKSVLEQNYTNFKVLLIDDCSTDDTAEKIDNYLSGHSKRDLVNFIKNKGRLKKLANLYTNINDIPENEIIIELDGDDYLIDNDVLKVFNYYYQKTNALIVHTNYINYPTDLAKELKQDIYSSKTPHFIIKNNWFRHYPWIYSGIRSYKAGMFQKIKLQDLILKNSNDFYPVCHDMAMFYPMLEMAGDKIAYIAQPMLLRNIDSPINDFKTYEQQFRISIMKEIRSAKKYKQLKL